MVPCFWPRDAALKAVQAEAVRTAQCILHGDLLYCCLLARSPFLVSRRRNPHIAKRPFLISLSLYSFSFCSDPLL